MIEIQNPILISIAKTVSETCIETGIKPTDWQGIEHLSEIEFYIKKLGEKIKLEKQNVNDSDT
jgi:hypothetical protein